MPYILKTWNADGVRVKIKVSDELYRLCMEKKAFLVQIENAEGRKVVVEVSESVYEIYEEGHLAWDRRRKECANHLEARALEDYTLQSKVATEPLERVALRRELLHTVHQALQSCTPIQRERFYLHDICGYSFEEIASLHECSPAAVFYSVREAKKKLKNFI